MHFLSLIEAKRDGKVLSRHQIQQLIRSCTANEIPDYQLAAFLMAVYFRGLNTEETTALTLSMRDSGEVLKFPDEPRPLADKHSTGGVGDKVSLPLAPLLACLGFRVPMISGRGLGITGGTLDKLDSIPGFKTSMPGHRIMEIVQSVGCVICGQTERMVPADKILYALRDVTGTVPSIPLIVASILSKKLAENLDALVLDVKFGAAAFMTTIDQARELAMAMVALGNQCGVNTRALLTSMNSPLGQAAGNWLEVKESVQCLEGRGPADLRELVLNCAASLLVQTKKAATHDLARQLASDCLDSGRPFKKWNEMLTAQGADLDALHRKLNLAHPAVSVLELKSPSSGIISSIDARIVGEVVRDLGGGRLAKDSVLNYDVGIDMIAVVGTEVTAGAVLARIHASDSTKAAKAIHRLRTAFQITSEPAPKHPLIHEVIG